MMRIGTARTVSLSLAVLLGVVGSAPIAGAVVSINVGSTTGAPGGTATFLVTLRTAGAQVGGTLNSVSFDPATPIVACTTNPGMTLSECALEPQGCTPGADCQFVRCLIAQFASPPPPIADGTILYSCSVKIAATASGSYQLVCSDASASGTAAHPLDTQCTNGQVQVVRTPTATRAATNTPTPTMSLLCVGDCDRNGSVTVDEILTMVNIALGSADCSACIAARCPMTIDQILTAVSHALKGCPAGT